MKLSSRKLVGTAAFIACTCLIFAADSQTSFGQGRGGRGGGGAESSGRGGPGGGGFRGGGGPGGGTGGGGFRGGPGGDAGGRGATRGGGGPTSGGALDFLTRMDANGNGMLEPSEMQGPASFMIQRLAQQNSSISTSRAIPISLLVREMERMRSSRTDQSQGASRGSSEESERGRSSGQSSSEPEPLVPGFGELVDLPPPLAFGVPGELFEVSVTDADRRTAEDRFQRYDRNKDGQLSKEEMSSGRWSDDPFQFDRNRDGKISVGELAMRYASQRSQGNDNNRGSTRGTSSAQSTNNSGRSRGATSSNSSNAANDRMATMVASIFERYDTNKNGYFDKSEWSGFRTDPSAADENRDGRIDKKEMSEWMSSRFSSAQRGGPQRGGGGPSAGGRGGFTRGGGEEGGRGEQSAQARRGDSGRDAGRSQDASASGGPVTSAKSYRFITPTELLAKLELPEWFTRSDINQDGQVMMAEFATGWSDNVARDFAQFDLNSDGIVTASECIRATEQGAIRGNSMYVSTAPQPSYTASSSSTTSSAPAAATTAAAATPQRAAPQAAAGGAAIPSEIPPAYLKYAVGLIDKYDANNDQVLTKEEWSNVKNPTAADADGDGRITPKELAASLMQR